MGKRTLEHKGRLKLHVSATQNWGKAPRIPELTKQPTRSGYPKPLPEKTAEQEDILPENLPEIIQASIPEESISQVEGRLKMIGLQSGNHGRN